MQHGNLLIFLFVATTSGMLFKILGIQGLNRLKALKP
jgi:hypothetical protein